MKKPRKGHCGSHRSATPKRTGDGQLRGVDKAVADVVANMQGALSALERCQDDEGGTSALAHAAERAKQAITSGYQRLERLSNAALNRRQREHIMGVLAALRDADQQLSDPETRIGSQLAELRGAEVRTRMVDSDFAAAIGDVFADTASETQDRG